MRGDLFFQLPSDAVRWRSSGPAGPRSVAAGSRLASPAAAAGDVRRLPRLPPLDFDLLELLQGGSVLAAEFGGPLLQRKLLGLKRRRWATRFASRRSRSDKSSARRTVRSRSLPNHRLRRRRESFPKPLCRAFFSPVFQHEPPAGFAELAGFGQLGLRRHFALQPQSLQVAPDVGGVAAA